MTDERWRCFVAVPLSDELRGALAAAVERWRAHPATDGLRWTEPAALHLTLAFLGGQDPRDVPAVAERIRSVATGHRPFVAATGRLGAFHRGGSARVLWYGVEDPDGALSSLAGGLATALNTPLDEPFRPHVTLARARRRPVDLRGWIEPASLQAPVGRLGVSELRLMRSHLGGGPARYETLASIPLSGAPA
jgi:2'-5' RNA ligase